MARTINTDRALETLGTLNTRMTELGEKLHEAGVPWEQIGAAIGTTRQGAAKRFAASTPQARMSTGRITGRGATGVATRGRGGRTGAGRNGRIRGG